MTATPLFAESSPRSAAAASEAFHADRTAISGPAPSEESPPLVFTLSIRERASLAKAAVDFSNRPGVRKLRRPRVQRDLGLSFRYSAFKASTLALAASTLGLNASA